MGEPWRDPAEWWNLPVVTNRYVPDGMALVLGAKGDHQVIVTDPYAFARLRFHTRMTELVAQVNGRLDALARRVDEALCAIARWESNG